MNKGSIINVRASKFLGTPPTKATVLRVVHSIGHEYYKFGLYEVHCHDDPPEWTGYVDSRGYIYTGPPLNGHLVYFP